MTGMAGPRAAAPNPAIKLASVQPENAICHDVDADHFPLDMSSGRRYFPGGSETAIFLLRTGGLML